MSHRPKRRWSPFSGILKIRLSSSNTLKDQSLSQVYTTESELCSEVNRHNPKIFVFLSKAKYPTARVYCFLLFHIPARYHLDTLQGSEIIVMFIIIFLNWFPTTF